MEKKKEKKKKGEKKNPKSKSNFGPLWIGNVRGSGFFLGMELTRDLNMSSLEPAGKEASYVANRLRDYHILCGTDGPFHNVVKIRPPMCFNMENAREMVNALHLIFENELLLL